ncbi:MAG: hypothetical protein QW046_06070, partial [Candidatus Micrarchaeaceae archaeon]
MPAPSMPNLGIKITDNTKFDANERDEESKNILVLRIACNVTPRILDDINIEFMTNIVIIGMYPGRYSLFAIKSRIGCDIAATSNAIG